MNCLGTYEHLIGEDSSVLLRNLFDRVYHTFPFYRHLFDEAQVSPSDEPLHVLSKLPIIDTGRYLKLQQDLFDRLRSRPFLTEYTSGTTGTRKIRFTTLEDERAEAKLCLRFFRQCDIGAHDRVAALDIDSADIYLFYGEALSALRVQAFDYFSVPSSPDRTLDAMFKMSPTVLITIPSLLARLYPYLYARRSDACFCLSKIIYIGESMDAGYRRLLEHDLGVELFSFFGSTEIGSVGGECHMHNGVHLYNDQVIPSIVDPVETPDSVTGDIVWTTLHFRDQPLVKYSTRDVASISTRRCSCGSKYPLMTNIFRNEDQFVVYGHKFKYCDFYETISTRYAPLEYMCIEIDTCGDKEHVSFMLPSSLARWKTSITDAILNTDDLRYFVDLGFVEVTTAFSESRASGSRKLRRVVDRRHAAVQEGSRCYVPAVVDGSECE